MYTKHQYIYIYIYYYIYTSVVEGYKWFGKPRSKQNSPRWEGGVGFLVRKCLANEVEFINSAKYEESVWMKVRS